MFDTFLTPLAAADLRTASQIFTGRNPGFVANSHWHFDHSLGNAMFGAASIYGTETTRQLLAQRGSGLIAALADPTWVDGTSALQVRHDEERRPLYRHELGGELAARTQLRDERDRIRIRTPDAIFETRHTFPGPRSAMIVEGAGHSESDTVLFVTDDEVLFTGDLVSVGVHPTVGLSDLARWRDTLAKVARIRPRVLVPGHGPVSDVGACDVLREYLDRLEEAARAEGPPEIPSEYGDWIGPGRFARSVETLRAAHPA